MYKTPCCNKYVPWLKAVMSRPMSPIVCPDCGIKYHDGAKRKFRLLVFSLLFTSIVVMLASFFPQLRMFRGAGFILGGLGIFFIVLDEYLVVRKGVFDTTTLRQQKKDLKLIFIGAVILLASIFYEIVRAL